MVEFLSDYEGGEFLYHRKKRKKEPSFAENSLVPGEKGGEGRKQLHLFSSRGGGKKKKNASSPKEFSGRPS